MKTTILALALSFSGSMAFAMDDEALSPAMMALKADLQAAFDNKDADQLFSHFYWEEATEEKRQELIDVFTRIIDADHGRSAIDEITPGR